MVKALRRRHVTEQERKRGLGPMAADVVEYDLDRRETMTALKKAIFEDASTVTWDDYRALDAGRPVREEALKYAIGDMALRKSLADPADAEGEPDTVYEAVRVILADGRTPLAKCETATLYVEGGIAELRARMLRRIAQRDARVSSTDMAALDAGQTIRKGCLDALLASDESLEPLPESLGGGQPLRKSRGVRVDDFLREHGDVLKSQGVAIDVEASRLMGRVVTRSVSCTPSHDRCEAMLREAK